MKEKLSSVCDFSFIKYLFTVKLNFLRCSMALTVKVQCNGGITFAQLVLGRHLVFTGILYGNIFNFKGSKVLLAVFIHWQLKIWNENIAIYFLLYLVKKFHLLTLCLSLSETGLSLWAHFTAGTGSALIRHSNKRRFPSSSWRIAGFFKNVGARPSICLFEEIFLLSFFNSRRFLFKSSKIKQKQFFHAKKVQRFRLILYLSWTSGTSSTTSKSML